MITVLSMLQHLSFASHFTERQHAGSTKLRRHHDYTSGVLTARAYIHTLRNGLTSVCSSRFPEVQCLQGSVFHTHCSFAASFGLRRVQGIPTDAYYNAVFIGVVCEQQTLCISHVIPGTDVKGQLDNTASNELYSLIFGLFWSSLTCRKSKERKQ
eukprot:6076656-Amphidinium_carterae.1